MSPETMTERQREWINHIALDAARHVQRRSLIGFLILLVGVGTTLYVGDKNADEARKAIVDTGRIVSVDGCNRDFQSRKEVREVLQRSKDFQLAALERGDITQAQYKRAVEFYNDRLKGLPLPDCRHAESIVSDDPDEVPAMPKPLHP